MAFIKISDLLTFTVGKTYYVTFEGTEYECVAWAGDDGSIVIGNGSIYGGDGGNGEPFSCNSYADGSCYLNTNDYGTYDISISSMEEEIHYINPKYIKDMYYETDPVETTILEEQILDFSEGSLENILSTMLVEGQSYTVIWDNIQYECIARRETSGCIYIGNQTIGTADYWEFPETIESNEPFFIVSYANDNWSMMYSSDASSHSIEIITMQSKIIKINEKYLPDDVVFTGTAIGRAGEGNGAEIFNDYVYNRAYGMYSHAEGNYTTASKPNAHAEGNETIASGYNTHAEGNKTTASGHSSHAEGDNTISSGKCSHAEGFEAQAIGEASHAEGGYKFENDKLMDAMIVDSYYYSKLTEEIVVKAPMAYGKQSHAEGSRTLAYGLSSHAEGDRSMAFGTASHAEGDLACASGNYSHAEGYDTMASGDYSHTEGEGTIASGTSAHAEGGWTRALGDYQHAQGKNNIEDAENRYAHIVGNGESTLHRSNAHTLDWDGNAEFQGDVKANACGGENPISLIALYNTIQTLTERIAVLEAALNTDSLTETDANALVEEVFN